MTQYKSIHTTVGLGRMAAAEASGVPINLTEMAVGDGNGNEVQPDQAQTNLVREMYRANINRVYQDPENPSLFTAELIVPADAAGFTIREVGVFDADGGMFVVGNLPATYKPNIVEGSYADTVVRVQFMVTNASVVTLMIDPSVAMVSQTWVINNITPAFLLPGGTTGQVLRKASNADGDTEWASPADTNVLVNVVEEHQTLAAAQTTVNLTTTNTLGLAVYVEGVRLPKQAGVNGWQPDGTIITRFALGKSYADGTKIICVQNEPASNLEDPLAKAQNLADLPDKALARANLGVYSKSEVDQKVQPGAVMYYGRFSAPAGWLKANGAAVSRVAYAALFSAIGTTFGSGDGFNTFNLPDLRGEFIRGWDDSRGLDAGRSLGVVQNDEFRSHTHGVREGSNVPSAGALTSGDDFTNINASIQTSLPTGGAETRPRNVALLACIKF